MPSVADILSYLYVHLCLCLIVVHGVQAWILINDYFGKLGAIYGQLNLICKPMQIYNSDETRVNVVHKPGKVVAEMGRHKVYAVTSAEKGKTLF